MNINTNMTAMRRKIMRRVYTIFAARVVSSRVTLNVALFATALVTFGEVVHVKRIVEGLASSSFLALPGYVADTVIHAAMRGEVVTLAALGVMIFTALSIQWQFRQAVSTKLPDTLVKA